MFPEDAFCGQCGTRIQARDSETGLSRRTLARQTIPTMERLGCGSCNSPILPGELFCSTCGARHGQTLPGGESRVDAWSTHRRKLEEATRGRFEFIRELGSGGMGTVFLARELDLDRLVAVKVLSASWLSDNSMVERFRREARTIAKLRHPSIVHVHGVGQAGDLHYFMMDFIEGVSLGRILRSFGPLSIAAVQAVFFHVGSALSYAHRPGRGVIHRDIKPGNIMLDTEGNSFVTDFGISKISEAQSGLTMTGLIMGTPEYMSPEQCRGDIVTKASDQYALGAVVYAMLTGAPPFTGQHYRVLMAHTTEEPVPVRDLRPDCPAPLADALARMLRKLPAERWPDITDALKAAGIRPIPSDDPVREELSNLVRRADDSARAGAGPSPASRDPRTPTWLRILAVPDLIETGDEIDLRVTLGYADGREEEGGEVRWETTDPAIARVDPATGQLQAVGPGAAVITAWAGGIAESVSVEVRPERTAKLELAPREFSIEAGETRRVTPVARSRHGRKLERAVLWSSSDPNIVSITEDGTVHAHREGTASILAHCEGVGAAINVRVVPATVALVRIEDAPDRVNAGDSLVLRADPRTGGGQRVSAPVQWSSASPEIARIGSDGRLEAIAAGTARIHATCEGRSATVTIVVAPAPVARIEIRSAPGQLSADERATLHAVAVDGRGRELDRGVSWASAADSILRVDADGRAVAIAAGRAEVIATCEGVHAHHTVVVLPPPLTRIELSQPPSSLMVGDTFHIEARGRDARDRPTQPDIYWRVDDAAVLESLGGGQFRALRAGSAVAIAQAGNVVARAPLTIEPVRVAALAIEGLSARPLVGERIRLRAVPRDQRGRPVEQAVRWSVDDPARARISETGVLEIVAAGNFTVTAECEGARDTLRIAADGASGTATAAAGVVQTGAPGPGSATTPDAQPYFVPPTVIAPFPRADATGKTRESPPIAGAQGAPSRRPGGTQPPAPPQHAGGEAKVRKLPPALWAIPVVVVLGVLGGLWMLLGSPDTPEPAPSPELPAVVASVAITGAGSGDAVGERIELTAGDTMLLAASGLDASGATLAGRTPVWSSSDEEVATVEPSGTLIARAGGSARITAAVDGIAREIDLTVRAPVRAAAVPPPPATRTAPPPAQPQTRQQATPPHSHRPDSRPRRRHRRRHRRRRHSRTACCSWSSFRGPT
jgi:uncharacterized protein YjdB